MTDPENAFRASGQKNQKEKRMKTLIVYYSRGGNTKKAAEDLAAELGADLAEIREDRPRKGLFGFLRSGMESSFKKIVPYRPLTADPAKYERVIVATPVWAGNLSSPMRSYLNDNARHFAEFGILLTHSGPVGGEEYLKVMDEAEKIVGKKRAFSRSVQGAVSVK